MIQFLRVILSLLLIVFLISLWLAFWHYWSDVKIMKFGKLEVKDSEGNLLRTLKVEIADSIPKQMRGLSGRDDLKGVDGMVFLFKTPKIQSFWMPDMKFSLDIVWIKNQEVVGIEYGAEPLTSLVSPKTYLSPEAVEKVLEVKAGEAEKMGIIKGASVILINN